MKWIFTAFVVGKAGNILGYQMVDVDTYEVCYKKPDDMVKYMKRVNVTNLTLNGNTIVCQPFAAERYARLTNDGMIDNKLVAMNLIEDRDEMVMFQPSEAMSNMKGAYKLTLNIKGKVEELGQITPQEYALRLSTNVSNCSFNINVVGDTYELIPNGTYKVVKGVGSAKNKQIGEAVKKTARMVKREGLYIPPVVSRETFEKSGLKDIDETTGLTVEQKLQYTKLALRETEPFLYAALCTLRTEEASKEGGTGVSVKTAFATLNGIYFYSDFVKGLPLDELYFITQHELYHVLMKHHYRGKGKVGKMFNIACDLYINRAIAVNYGLDKDITKSVMVNNVRSSSKERKFYIRFPSDALYSAHVDLDTDTPETLYAELMKKAQQQMQQMGGGSGSNGQGSSSGGGSGDGSSMSDDEKLAKAIEEVLKELGVEGEYSPDIADTHETAKKSKEEIRQLSQAVQQRAKVIAQKNGYGLGEGLLDRYIASSLAPKVNWRSLLKKKLTAINEKISSFSSPDRRFLSRGKIYPGPKKIEGGALERVLVAIDTSGSISDEELGVVIGQLNQLFRAYKVSGDLVWWDTKCTEPQEFRTFDDILKMRPKGFGGTDPSCIFEMLKTHERYKRGSFTKPKIALIFTDGYFGALNKEYGKQVDTIWIVFKDCLETFQPPFGVVAPFKIDD